MRSIWYAVYAAILALGAARPSYALDENSKKYEQIGEISDVALKAIEIAKPEFLKWEAHPGAFTVDVIETDHLFQVTFCLDEQKQTITFTEGDKKSGRMAEMPRFPDRRTGQGNT